MSEVVILVLINGREILGEACPDESLPGTLKIKHPTIIASGHNPQTGAVDVHMEPLLALGAKKEVDVEKSSIAYTYEPVADIANKFRQMFGKIITPSQGIIKP